MILSMTGYGMGVNSSANYRVTAELKSLNSKYFDLAIKLPSAYNKYETKLRNHLMSKLQRGKVLAAISVEVLNETKRSLHINHTLAKAYYVELMRLKETVGLTEEIDFPLLLSLPEVIPEEALVEDPEEWTLIEQSIEEAAERLLQNRTQEGEALNKDLSLRRTNIAALLQEVEKLLPERKQHIRDRLEQALQDIRNKIGDWDQNRFEQEVLFYLEKLDITEEIVRLSQHLTYFAEVQALPENSGRKLQFLSQEMGREINTIGSKANSSTIQRLVVQMKDELEKIKEQVHNIV
ncbi:MAG: YicC/YloC family endoribonuclease [Bacteroidota bacterium]